MIQESFSREVFRVRKVENQDNLSQVLCFGCASIYNLSNNDIFTCPFCNYSIDEKIYRKIIKAAKTAVYYGYDYRRVYEKQINGQGKITQRFAISDPVAIFCFMGVAALSGVIGGAAYDLVKKVIVQIIEKSKDVPDDIGQAKIAQFSKDNIEIFIQYIREYHQNKLVTADEVNLEIEKERIIGNLADILYPVLKKSKPIKDEFNEAIDRLFNKGREIDELKIKDFESFWNNIEK